MSDKKSQLVIPINPQTFFTTLFAAAVIAIMTYVWITIPGQIKDLRETEVMAIKGAVVRIEAYQENTARQIQDMLLVVSSNSKDVREIKESRFSDSDAGKLSKSIITDIKMELTPWFTDVMGLKRQMGTMQKTIDQLTEEIHKLKVEKRKLQ